MKIIKRCTHGSTSTIAHSQAKNDRNTKFYDDFYKAYSKFLAGDKTHVSSIHPIAFYNQNDSQDAVREEGY